MPAKDSAAKRHRQNLKRRMRNKMVKSRIRSSTRKLQELVNSGSGEHAQEQFNSVAGLLDRAVSKGVIHSNTAARKKHRLHKTLAGIDKAA